MRHGALTMMITGAVLVLGATDAAWSGTVSPGGVFQMAQATSDDVANPPKAPAMVMSDHGMMGHGMMGDEDAKGRHDGQGRHFDEMCETADASHAAMMAYAEVRLKITDAQKPAWAKFTEASKTAHQAMTKLCTEFKGKPEPAALPDRLARDEKFAIAELSHIQALRPALDELYKQLIPDQQKLADTLPLCGPDHHGHGHDRDGGHDHDGDREHGYDR